MPIAVRRPLAVLLMIGAMSGCASPTGASGQRSAGVRFEVWSGVAYPSHQDQLDIQFREENGEVTATACQWSTYPTYHVTYRDVPVAFVDGTLTFTTPINLRVIHGRFEGRSLHLSGDYLNAYLHLRDAYCGQ